MSDERVPFELTTMADNLKKQASQIDSLIGLILIMMSLWLFSEFYNGFEYAKSNVALFALGDAFIQEVKVFKSNIESTLASESFNGTYQVFVQTSNGQVFYGSGARIGNHIYPIVKITIQADNADYGYDVRIIKIDTYPENSNLRNKIESDSTLYFEQFSGIVQDVSRQITRRQEFSPPDISLFSISAPSKWFPMVIALISIICSQIINSFGVNLIEFIGERKKHEYKGARRAFLDRITVLLTPALFIQSYQNKKWYPFSGFVIGMISTAYVLLIPIMALKVNFYREYNDSPIVMDLTQLHVLNAVLIVGSLLMINRSLNKLVNTKVVIASKERKA